MMEINLSLVDVDQLKDRYNYTQASGWIRNGEEGQ